MQYVTVKPIEVTE